MQRVTVELAYFPGPDGRVLRERCICCRPLPPPSVREMSLPPRPVKKVRGWMSPPRMRRTGALFPNEVPATLGLTTSATTSAPAPAAGALPLTSAATSGAAAGASSTTSAATSALSPASSPTSTTTSVEASSPPATSPQTSPPRLQARPAPKTPLSARAQRAHKRRSLWIW